MVFALLLPAIASATGGIPMGPWVEVQQITPDDANEPGVLGNPSHWGVFFGADIAMDGGTLAVGTQPSSLVDSGEPESDGYDWVYVFQRDEASLWTQKAKLIPDDAHQGDSFGSSLSLDEHAGVIVVGNPAAGKVYVFERDAAGTWSQTTAIERAEASFGFSVSVSGDMLIAAAEGHLFVYEQTDEGWKWAGKVEGAGGPAALVGDTIVARSLDDYSVYAVYGRLAAGWLQAGLLDPLEDAGGARPDAVAISEDGSTVVLGAPLTSPAVAGVGPNAAAVGTAWIYERTDDGWVEAARLENPDPGPFETFGSSASVSDDIVVVGAPRDLHNGGERAGAAYVYERVNDTWVLSSKLRNHDAGVGTGSTLATGDWFGKAVGVSGGTVVVGAPYDDNRRDGTPFPLDDDGDVPPCVHRDLVWGCDEGEYAGAVYVFEPVNVPGVLHRAE